MSHTEQSPLLNGYPRERRSFYHSTLTFVRAEGEPSWVDSYRWFVFGSWVNLLLLLVPLAAAAHYLHWDAPLRFGFSFAAIIPLAKLLGDATEQMSLSLGQTLAGLLNATFGNAVEIIVGITALLQGEVRIVQTSMLGSVLSNILLVLGCSFLAGGIYNHESEFQVTAPKRQCFVFSLVVVFLILKQLFTGALRGLLIISRGTAILLLGVYIAYLIFQLKTHAISSYQSGKIQKLACVVAASVGHSLTSLQSPVVTVTTSFVADYLVASIEETAKRYNIPKSFIGLILLPLSALPIITSGKCGEHVTSVWMAMKDKMELTIGICVGSSIQIATFVVPLLVVIGWITGHELTLFFADFEVCTAPLFPSQSRLDARLRPLLSSSLFLTALSCRDGKSNYMEGLMLITLYFVIALACIYSFGYTQISGPYCGAGSYPE
ncbi:Sodium/calcium exchanger protein-domain-containing protein [Lactarius quietus]|nr:Sodium/calcium exchanger protein-domain-containing protein [Lactarius quietus]